jgi:chorismate dehydratase
MARDLWSDLVLAKETAYRSFERLAASASERKWMGEEGLVRYWRTISYDLTPAHLAGLSRFYREARALGLVPGVPAPVFLPGTGR